MCIRDSRIHNSAVTLLDDWEVVFSLENERLSNIKYDKLPYNVIQELPKYTDNVDCIGVTGVQAPKIQRTLKIETNTHLQLFILIVLFIITQTQHMT